MSNTGHGHVYPRDDELIEVLRAAQTGSAALDSAVAAAFGWRVSARPGPSGVLWHEAPKGSGHSSGLRAPNFTTSLDAALTLLLEGEDWHIQSNPSIGACWASVGRFTRGPLLWKHTSPAIALCIAALEARRRATA